MNANTTELPDLYARLTDTGDFYFVHPLTDKGRDWFAQSISDARGFTYVEQKNAHALLFQRAGESDLRVMIDCGTGPAPSEIAAHLPANVADYLRTANQSIPLNSSRKLKCDGVIFTAPDTRCADTVTHIDEKGFTYCHTHGERRKNTMRCRQLTRAEIRTLESDGTISYRKK